MTNEIKEAADRRLETMTFTDELKRSVRAEAPSRRGLNRRLLFATAVAVATLAALTTVAFATGWIESIFGNGDVMEYGAEQKYAQLEELAATGEERTADNGSVFTQSYYDGQQLILGLAYDGSRYMRMDGIELNGVEPEGPTGSTTYRDAVVIENLQFPTPLPEVARDKESVQVKLRLGLLDDSADYFRLDEQQNAIPATRAEYQAQSNAAPIGLAAAPGDTTAVFAEPRQFEYVTLTVKRSATKQASTIEGDSVTTRYSAKATVISSPVNTKLNVSLTKLSQAFRKEYAERMNESGFLNEYRVLCDGKELAGFGTSSKAILSETGELTGIEYESELELMPEGAKALTIIPVYTDGREASAEAIRLTIR